MSVVYELPVVKVKREAVLMVRALVKGGFYRLSEAEKRREIKYLSQSLSTLYGVKNPPILFGKQYSNSYSLVSREIRLTNESIISFLHEYRHHLQKELNVKFKGLTIEQDARAWSMRVFSQAVPKMFLESVKKGKVLHVKYDRELDKVVDDCTYI